MQSQVRFNRVAEKVLEKVPGDFGAEPGQVQRGSQKVPEMVWEAFVQSQVRFNRICGHLIHRNQAEAFPALGFARFRKICKMKRCGCWGYHRSFLNLTTSKTKQFCETPPIYEVDNTKNETILRDFLQKRKVECRADGLVPMRFAIFPFHLSKVLRLPRKSDARSYEVLRLSRKIIFPKLKILCNPSQQISALTS